MKNNNNENNSLNTYANCERPEKPAQFRQGNALCLFIYTGFS